MVVHICKRNSWYKCKPCRTDPVEEKIGWKLPNFIQTACILEFINLYDKILFVWAYLYISWSKSCKCKITFMFKLYVIANFIWVNLIYRVGNILIKLSYQSMTHWNRACLRLLHLIHLVSFYGATTLLKTRNKVLYIEKNRSNCIFLFTM